MSDDPVRDALTESLLLHVRNLIETFWGSSEGRKARESLGIVYEKMPEDIGRWYGELSKCVVHLPDDRPPAKQPWDFSMLGPALLAKIEELRKGIIPSSGWEGDRELPTKLLIGAGPIGPDNVAAMTAMISPTGTAMPAQHAAGLVGAPGTKP